MVRVLAMLCRQQSCCFIVTLYPIAIHEIMPAYVNKYNEDMAEYELALKAEQVHIHVL